MPRMPQTTQTKKIHLVRAVDGTAAADLLEQPLGRLPADVLRHRRLVALQAVSLRICNSNFSVFEFLLPLKLPLLPTVTPQQRQHYTVSPMHVWTAPNCSLPVPRRSLSERRAPKTSPSAKLR